MWFTKKKAETFCVAPEISATGINVIEEGGNAGSTGFCLLIGNKYGRPRKAIYTWVGRNPCGKHAVIPVRSEDIIVKAELSEGVFSAKIGRVVSVGEKSVVAEVICKVTGKEWSDPMLESQFQFIVATARTTCDTFMCDRPMFCIPTDNPRG